MERQLGLVIVKVILLAIFVSGMFVIQEQLMIEYILAQRIRSIP